MRNIKISVIILCMFSFAAHAAGYYFDSFLQAVLLSIGSAVLSVAIALIVLNIYLNSSERKRASSSIVAMLKDDLQLFHNDFLINIGHNKLGIDAFETLIDKYQRHNRNPQALSMTERDFVVSIPFEMRDTAMKLMGDIVEKLREIQVIIGWSYNPKVTAMIFDCRKHVSELNATLARVQSATSLSTDEKSRVCELYLDIHGLLDTILMELLADISKKLTKEISGQ